MRRVVFNFLLLVSLLNCGSLFAQSNAEGTVSNDHSRYCKSIEKACMSRYDTTVFMLRQRYVQRQITPQEYSSSMEKVVTNLNQAFQNLDTYANQLAMIHQENQGSDLEVVAKNFVDLNVMPMIDDGASTASNGTDDYDFIFKGLNFADACFYFGNYYQDLDMKDMSAYYFSMALDMYETLNGYEGSDFTDQIKQLKSIIAKINK